MRCRPGNHMKHKSLNRRSRSRQSGNAILEAAIVLPCLTLMFFGSIGLGLMLGRYSQAIQVARDVAHMYADGVDFSQTASQNIVTQKLAAGTGMTNTGGNGVVVFSQIRTVYLADCTAAAISAANCANQGQPVFVQRIVVGNSSLRSSAFGTPTSALMNSQGNISPAVYLQNTDSSVRASGFEVVLDAAVQRATGSPASAPAQPQGDTAYVVELFFQYPDIGYLGWTTSSGAYVQFIFH